MKIFISLFGVVVGGGIVAPILLTSKESSDLPKQWKRSISAQPIMVCETQDNKKDKYQVNLVFEKGWSSTEENFLQENSLKDLIFDFVDVATGKSVNLLGHKFQGEEKFQLIITGLSGETQWGVSLQSKLGNHVPKSGDWTSLTCSVNNFVFLGEKCTHITTMCNITKDFKDIKFAFDVENKKDSKGQIKRGIVISPESKLKWKDGFNPEAFFTFQ